MNEQLASSSSSSSVASSSSWFGFSIFNWIYPTSYTSVSSKDNASADEKTNHTIPISTKTKNTTDQTVVFINASDCNPTKNSASIMSNQLLQDIQTAREHLQLRHVIPSSSFVHQPSAEQFTSTPCFQEISSKSPKLATYFENLKNNRTSHDNNLLAERGKTGDNYDYTKLTVRVLTASNFKFESQLKEQQDDEEYDWS